VRWVFLAAVLAAGCGVAASPAATPPVCTGAVSPNRLGAIHFLTRNVGLGLTLPAPHCGPMLAISRDGGRDWVTEGTPLAGESRVEHLIASSAQDAWAAVGNGRLMSTTDAGAMWAAETPRGQTVALALAGRTLWMLECFGPADTCSSVLLRKPLPGGVWTLSSPKLAHGISAAVALAGARTLLVSAEDQIVIIRGGGRRITEIPDPTWMGQSCNTPAALAAARGSWWLLCLGGAAAGSSDKALLRTTDGGRRWTIASQVTSLTAPPQPGAITREEPDALVAASPKRLWLAALNNLFVSKDGGERWSSVQGPNPQGYPASFDVLSSTHAWLLAAGQGLWRTTDGRHWHALGPVAVSP
jgi:photosystem II stability/assembly factor-like uncharacterized protein